MGWLDDTKKWLDDRGKDTENLGHAIAEAPAKTVQSAQKAITDIQKTGEDWTKDLEDIILKHGNEAYEQLPPDTKAKLEELKKKGGDIGTAAQNLIGTLKEIPGKVAAMPGDLFGAAKQILSIIRSLGGIVTDWKTYSTKIFTEMDDYMEELRKYVRRT